MMKNRVRFTAIVLSALLMLLALAACSGGDANGEGQPTVVNDTQGGEPAETAEKLADVYSKIGDLGVLPEMVSLSEEYVTAYYGFSEEQAKNGVFYVAGDSLLADTVVIVKAADSAAADIEASLVALNDRTKVELESYNPEQYGRACAATAKTVGSYVYFIISDDNAAIGKLIEENI